MYSECSLISVCMNAWWGIKMGSWLGNTKDGKMFVYDDLSSFHEWFNPFWTLLFKSWLHPWTRGMRILVSYFHQIIIILTNRKIINKKASQPGQVGLCPFQQGLLLEIHLHVIVLILMMERRMAKRILQRFPRKWPLGDKYQKLSQCLSSNTSMRPAVAMMLFTSTFREWNGLKIKG